MEVLAHGGSGLLRFWFMEVLVWVINLLTRVYYTNSSSPLITAEVYTNVHVTTRSAE